MTLADLRSMVQDYLGTGPIATTGDYLTTAMLDRAINLGYVDACRFARPFVRTITLTGVDDQATYVLPADVLEVTRVEWDSVVLTPAAPILLDRSNSDWRNDASGTPLYWMLWGAGYIRLHPAPESATGISFTAEAYISPSTVTPTTGTVAILSATTDTVAFPYAYATLPALYAVSYLAAHQLADDPRAVKSGEVAYKEYQSLLRQFAGSLVNVATYRV